jgi:hypothetical protein
LAGTYGKFIPYVAVLTPNAFAYVSRRIAEIRSSMQNIPLIP